MILYITGAMALKLKDRIVMMEVLKGKTQVKIAKEMNLSTRTVSLMVNSPLFKAELESIQSTAKTTIQNTANKIAKIFNDAAPAAADKIVSHTDDKDPNISIKACKEVIEKSDYSKAQPTVAPIVIDQRQVIMINEGLEEE